MASKQVQNQKGDKKALISHMNSMQASEYRGYCPENDINFDDKQNVASLGSESYIDRLSIASSRYS